MVSEPGKNMLHYAIRRNVKILTLIGIILELMSHCSFD